MNNWDADLARAPLAAGSTLFAASELAGRDVPPRDWLVPGLVPAGNVTLLGGPAGCGKSLLALQLAVGVVAGCPWVGNETAAGGCLYLSCEDEREELHRRLVAIVHDLGTDLGDLDRLSLWPLAGEDAILAAPNPKEFGKMRALPRFTELEAAVRSLRPALLVIDTLADVFGGDENRRAEARGFIALLRGLAMRSECAVVVLSHPSVAGMASGSGLSGSTAWEASVRSRLFLERVTENGQEPDPDARRLSVKKLNYGRAGGEIALRYEGGVFRPAGGSVSSIDRAAADTRAERVFLELLREFAAQGRDVSSKFGHGYAPTMMADDPHAEGIRKEGFKRAMARLFASGKIVVEEIGPPSRRRQRIIEKAAKP